VLQESISIHPNQKQRRGMRIGKGDQKKWLGYLYMLPALIIVGVIILYPLGYGAYTSLFRWNWTAGMQNKAFIGVENYIHMFTDDYFWNAIKNTLEFTFLSLTIEFILGLIIALLLNEITKGASFFRTIMMFPLMISDIVAALMWKMMLDPSSGVINQFLMNIHLGTPNWLGDSHLVIPAISMVDVWWQTGNIVIILLAGLQSLPREPIEMAQVDGANKIQLFHYLIWPQLTPFVKTAIVFRLIDLMRVFALSWAITGGGPVRASEVSQLYIYTQGMGKYLNIGYSISLAITFAIIVFILIAIVNKLLPEKN
jgi:multiple sugar transport system permease protein